MAGDCFWTALVNCFDDCADAPPPPDGDSYALAEDFDTLPDSRAPSGGPATFEVTSNAQVGVSSGTIVSTVTSADDGFMTVTFDGTPSAPPAIGLSIGFTLNKGALILPGFDKFVSLEIIATESIGTLNPVRLRFFLSSQTRSTAGPISSLAFDGIGSGYALVSDGEGGFYDEYDTFAGFGEDPTYLLDADASHDLRLMWDGDDLVMTVNGIENGREAFNAGALHHLPQFSNIVITVASFDGLQQTIAIDYFRLLAAP